MSIVKNKLYDKLSNVFIEVIKKIKDESILLTDIYVSVKCDDLLLSIYDDSENVLFKNTIDEWAELKENADFEQNVIDSLRKVLNNESLIKEFESLDIDVPFSVVLVNDDHEPVEDLIMIDKDIIFLDDEFIQKMDRELDDFFEKLMSDVK
ncbi:MAG: hypothetical protein IJ338_10220 [Bacteroidaceae bacterium]|nr:hypothetical protein [Bacteroidaceae bacterium]